MIYLYLPKMKAYRKKNLLESICRECYFRKKCEYVDNNIKNCGDFRNHSNFRGYLIAKLGKSNRKRRLK